MVLQKRPEMWADPMFAHNYPVEVWEHYDVNKDGILNKSELIVLAKDLVDRIISMCKDGMRTSMPKSSESDIDKMIKKELPHILPAKTLEESRKVMADHIFRELDLDKDGGTTLTQTQRSTAATESTGGAQLSNAKRPQASWSARHCFSH